MSRIPRKELVEDLRRLHEYASIGDLVDALSVLCTVKAQNESDSGDEARCGQYERAERALRQVEHLSV